MVYQIAIIEDNNNFLESLQLYLKQDEELNIALTSNSLEEFESGIATLEVDLVLLDINLPGISGVDGLKELKNKLGSNCKVIMLTINSDNQNIRQAISAGADGYLLKTEPLAEIHRQITDMLKYKRVAMSQQVFGSLQKIVPSTPETNPLFNKLTNREKDITAQILNGYDYKTVAVNLDISAGTVNFHLKSIYLKLDVNSKTELMALLLSGHLPPHLSHE